jgi:hypothetical protein
MFSRLAFIDIPFLSPLCRFHFSFFDRYHFDFLLSPIVFSLEASALMPLTMPLRQHDAIDAFADAADTAAASRQFSAAERLSMRPPFSPLMALKKFSTLSLLALASFRWLLKVLMFRFSLSAFSRFSLYAGRHACAVIADISPLAFADVFISIFRHYATPSAGFDTPLSYAASRHYFASWLYFAIAIIDLFTAFRH